MDDTTKATPNLPPGSRGFRVGRVRFSTVELLVALALLFVATPFIEGLRDGELIEGLLMTLVLVAAVLAVGGRKRMLLLTSMLMAPAVIGRWLLHFEPHLFHPAIALALAAAFLISIIVNLLRFVLRTPRVDGEVLCASISAYLLLGLLWSLAYRAVATITPGAFAFNATHEQSMQGFNAFYFSFVTLSTVGYGDITPVSSVARMLAVMESMTGTLYVAVLIARLVALYSTPVTANDPASPSS
jgi:hypothetical protein